MSHQHPHLFGCQVERVVPQVPGVVVIVFPNFDVIADAAKSSWVEPCHPFDQIAKSFLISHDRTEIDAVVDQRWDGLTI